MKPDVSIVLCTCDRAHLLAQSLPSLLKQLTQELFTYEVLVVDDGSTDDTAAVVALIKATYGAANLRYEYKPGGGVADARNFGVRHAAGEWIAFFDDDQLAESDWLMNLFNFAQAHQAVCVGGVCGLSLPDSAPALGQQARRALGERGQGRLAGPYLAPEAPGTGNVLLHTSLFAKGQGFDTRMNEGGADTEFFHRVRRQGHTLWFTPTARMQHLIPADRITPKFLSWVSTRRGVAAARIDQQKAMTHWFGNIFKRIAVTVLRDLPWRAWAWLTRNGAARLDCLCTMSFTRGYWRGSLHLLWPHWFRQEKFLAQMDFRSHGGERAPLSSILSNAGEAPPRDL